jgi:hypothetical protein
MAQKTAEEPEDQTTAETSKPRNGKADDPAASPAVVHHPMANQDAPRQGSG